MTLSEIKQSDKNMLVAEDVAPIIGCNPHRLRLVAKERPELLGFPVCVVGNRVKIPRIPFIHFIEGGY